MNAEDWPSRDTEWQIFSAHRAENAAPGLGSTSDGAIDENIYCLQCGYNLRGLSGDPIRCPECGEKNSLGLAAIPARYIEKALRDMETTLTRCVAFAVLAGLCLALALLDYTASQFRVCLAAGFVSLLVWWWFCRKTKSEFRAQPGWQSILISFHVAAGFGVAETLAAANALYSLQRRVLAEAGMHLALPIIGIPLLIWGWQIYRRARDKLRSLQQDTAVLIASQTVHHAMRRQRGGSDSV